MKKKGRWRKDGEKRINGLNDGSNLNFSEV